MRSDKVGKALRRRCRQPEDKIIGSSNNPARGKAPTEDADVGAQLLVGTYNVRYVVEPLVELDRTVGDRPSKGLAHDVGDVPDGQRGVAGHLVSLAQMRVRMSKHGRRYARHVAGSDPSELGVAVAEGKRDLAIAPDVRESKAQQIS